MSLRESRSWRSVFGPLGRFYTSLLDATDWRGGIDHLE